jgi:hypothetical protein
VFAAGVTSESGQELTEPSVHAVDVPDLRSPDADRRCTSPSSRMIRCRRSSLASPRRDFQSTQRNRRTYRRLYLIPCFCPLETSVRCRWM